MVQNAIETIDVWKSHQIRMVHQDECHLKVIESLSENTVLIVQHFAIKFLPAEYREAQSDFWKMGNIMAHLSMYEKAK